MSRKKNRKKSPAKHPAPSTPAERGPRGKPAGSSSKEPPPLFSLDAWNDIVSPAGVRELVESVVIAFVLAFLFRTFEAEAFVIPTGSMAPTLRGWHKELVCPECNYAFQVSASDEIDTETSKPSGNPVVFGSCTMCRHAMEVGPDNPAGTLYPPFHGDRILVTKFPYQFGEPERWDVAVFKYPGGAKTNFIKRIVGLPNETIAVSGGDLFVKPAEPADFELFGNPPDWAADVPVPLDQFTIARKPPKKILAMVQPVYDNDYVLPKLLNLGWPARWAPLAAESSAILPPDAQQAGTPSAGWETSSDFRSFHFRGDSPKVAWIGYRHIVPSCRDWDDFDNGQLPPRALAAGGPRPQLITDFLAYSTDMQRTDPYRIVPNKLGLHWVGDLAVECAVEVQSDSGEAIFELVEGGWVFRCAIDVDTGEAAFSIDGLADFHPTASTRVSKPGSYRVMFANLDDQLTLWIDGKIVRFDAPTTYRPLANTLPTSADLQPVRVGSRGAALGVKHLKIHRDLYYIAQRLPRPGESSAGGNAFLPITDFNRSPWWHSHRFVIDVLATPSQWNQYSRTRAIAFPLREDQFFVLGDNSANSKDGRLWENEDFDYHVPRELLIGKALFIYWPQYFEKIPGTNIPIRFLPNIPRMWFVR